MRARWIFALLVASLACFCGATYFAVQAHERDQQIQHDRAVKMRGMGLQP